MRTGLLTDTYLMTPEKADHQIVIVEDDDELVKFFKIYFDTKVA